MIIRSSGCSVLSVRVVFFVSPRRLELLYFQAAVTDAIKRALRLFGEHLGGNMSNKEVC